MSSSTAEEEDFARMLDEYQQAHAAGEVEAFWKKQNCSERVRSRVEHAHEGLAKIQRYFEAPIHTHIAENQIDSQPLRSMLEQPVRLSRFEIVRELGRGGFGVVYLANDPSLNRLVAIKIPRLEVLTPSNRKRFVKEAEIVAGLDHRHIVPVFEIGETHDVIYIVSLYCPGENLATWLATNPTSFSIQQAVQLMICLTDAVAYCHERNVLHRDIKPANILLFPTPYDALPFLPRLNDFGLAKVMESTLGDTATSAFLGTPLYMAPEQADSKSEAIGPATDVYALGAVLYELITGNTPFRSNGLADMLDQIRSNSPISPRSIRPEIPIDLQTICLKCLSKEPADRYADAGKLLQDLQAFSLGHRIQAKRRTLFSKMIRWRFMNGRFTGRGIAGVTASILLLGTIGSFGFERLFRAIPSTMNGETALEDPSSKTSERVGASFGRSLDVYVADLEIPEKTELTVEAWIRPDRPEGMVLNADGLFTLHSDNGNLGVGPAVNISLSEERFLILQAQDNLPPQKWSHVAVTYDGEAIRLFLNGMTSDMAVFLYDGKKSEMLNVAPPVELRKFWRGIGLVIGGNSPSSASNRHFQFHGSIDQVRVSQSVRYRESFQPPIHLEKDSLSIATYQLLPARPTRVEEISGSGPPAILKPYVNDSLTP